MRVFNDAATEEGDKVASQEQVKQRCNMEKDELGSQAPAHQEIVKRVSFVIMNFGGDDHDSPGTLAPRFSCNSLLNSVTLDYWSEKKTPR